jgi:hypothetical protein
LFLIWGLFFWFFELFLISWYPFQYSYLHIYPFLFYHSPVNYFSALADRTVRDRFARVTQIASLLSMESAREVLDYWGPGAGPVVWRLSASEVRKVLALRVDFRRDAIAQLAL